MTKPVSPNSPRASTGTLVITKATIVCGTDFSQQAVHAVEGAAALARRLDEPLVLVHAVNKESRELLPAEIRDSLCIYERAQLHEELERLRAAEVEVIEAFRGGKPEKVLLEVATREHARLLVVSSHGRKVPKRWVLGSVAERVAESSPVPTLVVRDSTPFTRWICGRKHLRGVCRGGFLRTIRGGAALGGVAATDRAMPRRRRAPGARSAGERFL